MIHELRAAGHVGAEGAQGLAQGAHEQGDLLGDALVLGQTGSGFPQ
jgi:hypothetical protein